jgi:predicted transcriptional regulator
MSQEDYIRQIEDENERLRRKLDEALEKYDNLYNSKDNLRQRIREIEMERMGDVGIPTKYKMTNEAYQDFKNMHGLTYREIGEQVGLSEEEVRKFMDAYRKDAYV